MAARALRKLEMSISAIGEVERNAGIGRTAPSRSTERIIADTSQLRKQDRVNGNIDGGRPWPTALKSGGQVRSQKRWARYWSKQVTTHLGGSQISSSQLTPQQDPSTCDR